MATDKVNNLEAGSLRKPLIAKDSIEFGKDDGECRITAVVLLSTLVAVTGSFCFGCTVGYSSAAQTGIRADLGLSIADYSMFGSILTFGAMIGAVFSGKISDMLGRKGTMWFCQIFCITGWLGIAYAKNSLWLDVGRFFSGIGVGLFSYVIPVYVAEITPKHVRGAFVFANQLMQNCGISLFFIIGNVFSWRTLAFIGLAPCICQVVGLFFIPESPRWLGKRGRDKECKAALQRLRGQDADVSQEATTIKETIEMFEQGTKSGIMELFQRRYAPSLVIGVGLMLLQQLSGSAAMTYYASFLFQRGGFPSSIGSTVLAIIMVPKAMMGLVLVEKMGRRPLLMVSATGMCLCAMLLSATFCLQSHGLLKELTPLFTCIGVLGSITTFAMGMGGLPWIIMSEIFPMNVKVSAGTIVTVANWSVSWMVTYAFNFMLQWNDSGTFLISSGVCAASIVFVYMLVPETKGRSLEDIQASLSNFLQ